MLTAPWNGRDCWIVAEVSANHEGDLGQALRLIKAAAAAGADAVKFQCFLPEEMTLESSHPAFRLTSGLWKGKRLWQLYREAATPWDWFPLLWEAAKDEGLVPFASVFGSQSLAFLEHLGCAVYKIASPEAADACFVRQVLASGKIGRAHV